MTVRRKQVLIVDDEPALRESVSYTLERNGFGALVAPDLKTAESLWPQASLIVLDLTLPDGSGIDLLKRIRARSECPVIILSSRDEETERVVALELGADDYVTKPFSLRELVARIRTVLRRAAPGTNGPPSTEVIEDVRGLSVHPDARRVFVGGNEVELSRTEFDLLVTMMRAPDRVFTRAQLLEAVWGENLNIADRTVDVHIKGLRKKLPSDVDFVQTVRGIGYRYTAP